MSCKCKNIIENFQGGTIPLATTFNSDVKFCGNILGCSPVTIGNDSGCTSGNTTLVVSGSSTFGCDIDVLGNIFSGGTNILDIFTTNTFTPRDAGTALTLVGNTLNVSTAGLNLGGVNVPTSTTNRNYAIQHQDTATQNLIVNVPWTDNNTEYSAGTGLSLVGNTLNVNTANQPSVIVGSQVPQTASSRYYAIQTNSVGELIVNVPWTGDSTIYTSDGDLTDNRVVNLNNKNLTFSAGTSSDVNVDSNLNVTRNLVVTSGITGSTMKLLNIPSYDDDGAAASGGLGPGTIFQTTGAGSAPLNVEGILMIKQ